MSARRAMPTVSVPRARMCLVRMAAFKLDPRLPARELRGHLSHIGTAHRRPHHMAWPATALISCSSATPLLLPIKEHRCRLADLKGALSRPMSYLTVVRSCVEQCIYQQGHTCGTVRAFVSVQSTNGDGSNAHVGVCPLSQGSCGRVSRHPGVACYTQACPYGHSL